MLGCKNPGLALRVRPGFLFVYVSVGTQSAARSLHGFGLTDFREADASSNTSTRYLVSYGVANGAGTF